MNLWKPNLFYMKILLPAFIGLLLLSSCEEDLNTSTIIGQWKLTETLADPGDGSGTYQAYDGNQIVTIYSDSSVTFNESLFCLPQTLDGGLSATIAGDSVYWEACDLTFRYELKNDLLFFYPPCIEPCGYKFEKIKD
jgi:hypothetical protein